MKNPLIPMGAITGNPSQEEINDVINSYAKQGIQQFLIYARSGCEIPYMSDRWIEVCGYIIEAAERENMHIWIYDEYNWPSGTCSGKVMQDNPEFFAQGVKVKDGACTLLRYEKYADILNPDAVDAFLKNTHEVYYKHFGKYFGTVIQGFFTDEPDFSESLRGGGDYPYTKDLEIFYKEACGRDLFTDMISPSEAFHKNFWPLLGTLYRKNFVNKINNFCVSHNVMLTGHTMDETNLYAAVKTCGNTICALRGFSLPGIDDIETNTTIDTAEWLTLGCAEAAARVSKNGALGELFALGPTDIVPAKVEQMIWLTSLFGIDHYTLAVSPLDARGNVEKPFYYNPMCYTNPWFEGYSALGKTAALAAKNARKSIASEVVIRYPATKTAKHLGTKKEKLTSERIYTLVKKLIRAQFQWQFIDEEETVPEGAYLIEITDDDTFDADTILSDVKMHVPRDFYVLENDEMADELFVRKYKDGSYVLLDLSDTPEKRNLTLCTKGKKTPLTINGRGHYTSGDPIQKPAPVLCDVKTDFSLDLSNDNTLRFYFNENQMSYTFYAEETLEDIQIAVRDYRFNGTITLDNIKLAPKRECTSLMKGLNSLYKCTDAFTLTKGKHTVTTDTIAPHDFYLPIAFLCGHFASNVHAEIRQLPQTVSQGNLECSTLSQYAGALSFTADIDIPKTPCALTFDSSQLYTCLFINEVPLGGRLSDFCWEIPHAYLGTTVKIRIVQYTSVAPIFGDIRKAVSKEFYEKLSDQLRLLWSHRYHKCGITNMKFLKSEG